MNDVELAGASVLSVVLIGPQEERRRAIGKVLTGEQARVGRELSGYPNLNDLSEILNEDHDAIIIDLDPDPERALDVVENISSINRAVTVMVYSVRPDS